MTTTDRECLGRVAAYATHTSIAQFKAFVDAAPPFTTEQFWNYLLRHGRRLEAPVYGQTPRDRDALALVKTREQNWVHALIWDAERRSLFDCKPDAIHKVVEQDFAIKCWIPIAPKLA